MIVRAIKVEKPEPETKCCSEGEGNDDGGMTGTGENRAPEEGMLGRFAYQSEDAPGRICKLQLTPLPEGKKSLIQFNYTVDFKNVILEHVWLNHQIQGMGRRSGSQVSLREWKECLPWRTRLHNGME